MNVERQIESHAGESNTVQGSEVERVYLTQAEIADVALPSGENVVGIPVIAGSTIRLPFSDENLNARFNESNGNLAIKSGDITIILLGYADAVDEGGVTILEQDGTPVDVAATLAATEVDLDIPTAAGPGAGDFGPGVENNGGVFSPFDPLDGLGGLDSVGGLDATALTYTVVEVTVAPLDPEEEDELTVAAEPEIPDTTSPINYNDGNAGDENLYRDTNVMVVLDISGSMKEDANDSLAGTQSRMSIAKAVLANLLHTYDTLGDVRVTVVVFNEEAATHFSWGSVADAIASLDTLVPEDRTNYAAAIETAQLAWTADGKLPGDTEDVIYFISDGKPTLGGGSGNHLTTAQKDGWNDFLENPDNGIDHVYAVGIGDDVGSEAAPDPDLTDVAQPDGNSVPPGDVIYVTDPSADLAEQLIETIEGEVISGNVLSGVDTSGLGDNGVPGEADAPGDGDTYIYTFSYDATDPAYAVEFSWDGTSSALTQVGAGGHNVVLNDLEVSFDTEFGRMTFDFATGGYMFTPGSVSGDTDVSFHYGTRDANGDVDEPGGVDSDGPAGGADLVISIVDVPGESIPAAELLSVMPVTPTLVPDEVALAGVAA